MLEEFNNTFCPSVTLNYEKPANIQREEMMNEKDDSNKIGVLSKDAS